MDTEQRQKAIGQFRLQLNGVFEPFLCYGLQDFVPEAIREVVILALQLHDRLSGKDVPIITSCSRERPTA